MLEPLSKSMVIDWKHQILPNVRCILLVSFSTIYCPKYEDVSVGTASGLISESSLDKHQLEGREPQCHK